MTILVIDDNRANLDAAKEQLGKDHEVTVVSSFKEAHTILGQKAEHRRNEEESHYVDWFDGPKEFDAVLTDLFMPASADGQGKFELEGKELPYGLVFAIAAMRRGTPKVAIITRGNHHSEPLLWALDLIGLDRSKPYGIGDITFAVCNDDGSKDEPKDYAIVLKKLLAFK